MCEAPLLSLTASTVSLVVDGTKLPLLLATPFIRTWFQKEDEAGAANHYEAGDQVKVEILFDKYTIVRGFHTAWKILDVQVGLDEYGQPLQVEEMKGRVKIILKMSPVVVITSSDHLFKMHLTVNIPQPTFCGKF